MNPVSGLIGNKTISALEQMAAFTQARQGVIAVNIANADTPGYRRRNVDLGGFQAALASAMDRRPGTEPLPQVTCQQVSYTPKGQMVVKPTVEPIDNVMFHDGTTGRIESEMTEMSRNQLLHQVSVDMIRHHYRILEMAIRGLAI